MLLSTCSTISVNPNAWLLQEFSLAMITAQMPGLFLRFIGIAEGSGAIGLILPRFLRIRPILTPLAACGLLIDMIGETVVTLLGGNAADALFPLVVWLLCAAAAYGRRSWVARSTASARRISPCA